MFAWKNERMFCFELFQNVQPRTCQPIDAPGILSRLHTKTKALSSDL